MPLRKPATRRRIRRRSRKRVPLRYRRVNPARTLVPRRNFVKLRYLADPFDNTTTTLPYFLQYRVNSLYDPEYSGTGHQPLGFDQMATLYTHYRVHAVHVRVLGKVRTANELGVFVLGCKGGTTIPPDIIAASEDASYTHKVVDSTRPFVISKYFDFARVTGRTRKAIQADDQYAALTSANPERIVMVNIGMQALDTSTSILWDGRVELTFYAEFNNLVTLSQS